jgi:hypothetical protein
VPCSPLIAVLLTRCAIGTRKAQIFAINRLSRLRFSSLIQIPWTIDQRIVLIWKSSCSLIIVGKSIDHYFIGPDSGCRGTHVQTPENAHKTAFVAEQWAIQEDVRHSSVELTDTGCSLFLVREPVPVSWVLALSNSPWSATTQEDFTDAGRLEGPVNPSPIQHAQMLRYYYQQLCLIRRGAVSNRCC